MTAPAAPSGTGVGPAPRVRPAAPASSRARIIVVALVIAAAIGFLVWKGLGDATVYFKTADEAVAQKQQLGTKRFRVEGLVIAPVEQAGDGVRFDIISAGEHVHVVHHGDPPELFKPDIPVVLEGHWQGNVYESDRIMVKHTTEYRQKNPQRVEDYVGKDSAGGDTGGGDGDTATTVTSNP